MQQSGFRRRLCSPQQTCRLVTAGQMYVDMKCPSITVTAEPGCTITGPPLNEIQQSWINLWVSCPVPAHCLWVTQVTQTNNADKRAGDTLPRTVWIQWSRCTQELPPAGSPGYVLSNSDTRMLSASLTVLAEVKQLSVQYVCSCSESARAPVRLGRNARVERGGAGGQRGDRL